MAILVSGISSSIRQKKRILFCTVITRNMHGRVTLRSVEAPIDVGNRGTIRYHYMDTKRFPDPNSKEKAKISALNLIDRWGPDVIVTIDDDAQILVGTKFVDDPDVSIVYAGVNNDPARYGYFKANNVYGVKENLVLNLSARR